MNGKDPSVTSTKGNMASSDVSFNNLCISDSINDFQCSKCAEKFTNTIARHICPQCEIYLCDNCLDLQNECLNSHSVFGRGNAEKWMEFSVDRCHKHGKKLDLHCDDHQELCCSACVAFNHK